MATIEAVITRQWLEQSGSRLITAIGRFIPPVVEWIEDDVKYESEWIENRWKAHCNNYAMLTLPKSAHRRRKF